MSTPPRTEAEHAAHVARHKLKEAFVKAVMLTGARRDTIYSVLGRMIEDLILQDGPTLRVALNRVAELSRVMKDNIKNRHHALMRLRK